MAAFIWRTSSAEFWVPCTRRATLGAVAAKKKAARDAKALPEKATAHRTARRRAKPGAASTQDLYTGMSGQFVAMSEFLWRGYNVAVPAVDAGEDIFVVEAEEEVLRRVQVKTAGAGTVKGRAKSVRFTLSRTQLNLAMGGSELFSCCWRDGTMLTRPGTGGSS